MLRQFLQTRRYRDIKLEEAKAWNFVLGGRPSNLVIPHLTFSAGPPSAYLKESDAKNENC
jgi:hypothetical protein